MWNFSVISSRVRTWEIFIVIILLTGCTNYKPFEVQEAHQGLVSRESQELKQLPPPQQKIVTAVYNFRDETGQYKLAQGGSYSFSTAVTQGATSILMRVLQQSGWFVPIERSGLSDLLNERKIIQSIRAEYKGPDGKNLGPLPPLLYAGVILEGGIISYDTNVITGGSGFRMLGIGTSGEFHQNQITIYLRAVSTQTGRVLENVHTTKTILSKKLQGGAFLYVDTNNLLETETGYSYNEPTTMAVTAAINEAVKELVIRGVKDDIWTLKNPSDSLTNKIFLEDKQEQNNVDLSRDYFDRVLNHAFRNHTAISLQVGVSRYQGDYRYPQARPDFRLQIKQSMTPNWKGGITLDKGRAVAYESFNNSLTSAQLFSQYYLFPYSKLSPYLEFGGGIAYTTGWLPKKATDLHPVLSGGGGFEYMVNNHIGINLTGQFDYSLDDKLDNTSIGRYNDFVWNVNMGLTYYFHLLP